MTSTLQEILIATNNSGKLDEMKKLLAGLQVELRCLADFENVSDVEETGSTFAENASLKARSYALQTGMFTLADDSGLEVEALDNRPGILSARYGGEGTSFGKKMDLLIGELRETGDKHRRARFVCSIAFADPTGSILHIVEGFCSGKVAEMPYGTGGFGYDPLFIPDGFNQTFGELGSDVKEKISHRAMAINEIIPFLLDFIAV